MTLRSVKLRVRALFNRRRAERELDEELSFHLERETQRQIANGLSPDEARRRAHARFGSVPAAADKCRDERGTRWVDAFVRDVVYAVRTFHRAPLAALTIVTTLALGLSLVTVVFTFLNAFIFRVDDVWNVHEMFAVERPQSTDAAPVPFTRPQLDDLLRETSVFVDAYALLPDIDTLVDGRTMTGTLVTGNFFQVLGVGAARGRTLTRSDDERFGGQPVVVLSHSGWTRHFAGDPNVIGRTLLLNGTTFQIVGVMPEGFRGLGVNAPDYWAPLALVGQFRRADAGHEDAVGVGIIGRLKAGLSREQALAQLVVWDTRRAALREGERPLARLTLEPKRGTVPLTEAMTILTPLFFAFGLILVIGCANVANLLLARGVARQREIGIRLAIGASRRRIISQLLTESLLLALVSAALAYAIARPLLEASLYALTSTMPPDLGDIRLEAPRADWRVALFLMAGAFVSTMFFALMPALQATRIELVRAIRGEVMRDARPGRTRGVLIAVQVTASALLLICSAVFLRSALAASTVDPGFRTSDTVTVSIDKEPTRTAILDLVRREPSVAAIAASSPDALSKYAGLAEGASGKSPIAYKFVSPEFFSVLGIDIVRGRGFTPAERSASLAVAVVSESAARQSWPDREALGQILQLEPEQPANAKRSDGAAAAAGDGSADRPALVSRSVVVVGIARDVPGFRFIKFKKEVVYVPISAEAAHTSLTVRVHGDPELARRALMERLTAFDPNAGAVLTLRTVAGMESYFLKVGFWMTLALGGLALLLTLSGLFSVLSYLVEQRTREIGVRIALGATNRSICVFMLAQLVRPVGVGLIVGGTLAISLGVLLLTTPAAETIGSTVRLFDPIAYSISLLCIIAACAGAALIPALRAGRIDPVATLRRD
jgi:predicted permease